MRIIPHFVLILLAVSILLKNVYCDSSNPLPKSSIPKTKASPKQSFSRKNIRRWEGGDEFFNILTHEISNNDGLRPRTLSGPLKAQVKDYTLATSWPPGVCYGESGVSCKISPVPAEFTIHGLWPNPNGDPSTDAFDANKLAPLASKLEKNWPNLESKQQSISINIKFWQNEWIKHGKFAGGLGVSEYFQKSLDLHANAAQTLVAKLAAEPYKIVPNNYNTKKLADIEAAVKAINGGFSATIRCVKRKNSQTQQIQEIRFSYDNKFQKQNNPTRSNCSAEILFPSASPV